MRVRGGARIAAVLAGVGLAFVPSGSAQAADDAQVAHVEQAGAGRVDVLVSVPPTAKVDLATVGVSFDGVAAEQVKAEPAGTAGTVQRTAILAIDTSESMQGGGFQSAKRAAFAFLKQVPDDVEVGVVTFAGDVTRLVEPGLDREAADEALRSVDLSKQTRLYDGVAEALAMAGDEGQRSVLVLSDGADTSQTSLDGTVTSVTDSGVRVDVIALDQKPEDRAALEQLATAGAGEVLPADDAALQQLFADQAEVLANQILVSAKLPAELDTTEATVEVTLSTSGGELTAEAFAPIQDEQVSAPGVDAGLVLPTWALFGGVGALALGAALVFGLLMMPKKVVPLTLEERMASYASGTGGAHAMSARDRSGDSSAALDTARGAAAEVLKRNRSLEERLSNDLAAAGSPLKATEWLLVWAGVFLGAGVIGLVLGRGSLLVGGVFLVLGAVGPWFYLRFKRKRRLKAFDRTLPDTMQLLSGSLQAGLSLAQGVDTIVREGQEPIASEFKRVLVETRLGVSLEDALQRLADRFGSKDFAWVVMAIRIQREVGGNLAELLDTVGNTMREREFLRRQVGALSAEGKISALVLSLLPPLFTLYLLVAQREYIMPMFTDMRGLIMMVGAAGWLGLGIFWMSKLVKVEV